MPSAIESITEGFPFPSVTPIIGQPNYESIAALHLQLNANAASIPSNGGNGQLGLLYLTVSPVVYATLSPVVFVPPVNPGITPIFPAGATGPQIANIRHVFKESHGMFSAYVLADKALKTLLLGAVDDMFVRSLQTKHIAYLNVTTRGILDHLYAQYARISPADIKENDVRFNTPYDSNLPIETLFDQIENGIDYAAAGLCPYTTEQVVTTAYQLIYATGLFIDDCKVWKRQQPAYKTWVQFKLDFAIAHREFRENNTTTASAAGYPTANNAMLQQETVDAIACLATATASDREAVAKLTATNSLLTREITTANAKLVTALLENTSLLKQLAGASRSSGTQEAKHYCWSCGFRQTHWSRLCTKKKDGHKDSAKAADTMGGSQANKA